MSRQAPDSSQKHEILDHDDQRLVAVSLDGIFKTGRNLVKAKKMWAWAVVANVSR